MAKGTDLIVTPRRVVGAIVLATLILVVLLTEGSALGSRGAAPSAIWRPKPGTTWQWQITGRITTILPVAMYDVDLFDAVPAATTLRSSLGRAAVPRGDNAGIVSRLHARRIRVICYLDTGAWESYRPDARLFPRAVIGSQTYASTGAPWTGEHWLDIRLRSRARFEPLIVARLRLAKRIGCDGVEPDQNNPIGNKPGFPITLANQTAWYLEIAHQAHLLGLSVGMKNGIESTNASTVKAFDWNLNEECNLYEECGVLRAFTRAGKAVFQVEYVEDGMTTQRFCRADRAAGFSGLLKRLELGTWRESC